jgi:tetratricopeptide (TPR) repeat protein
MRAMTQQTSQGARLLNKTGFYLSERGRYQETEPFYQRALAIQEEQLGASHPETAMSLNNLAALYWHQERHAEAEPLVYRAVMIC